jgi:hypothetical protein
VARVPELWTPGMAGPLDDLVARIHRRIEAFAREHGVEAMVEAELADGSLHRLRSISPEPGYGFVTFCPHGAGEPYELIVPLGAIRQLTIAAAEPEHQVGFSLPSDPS